MINKNDKMFWKSFQTPRTQSSFLGISLLAATFTFGEAYVGATKRTYFSKTRIIIFLGDFGPDVCFKFALSGPAMKKSYGLTFHG